MAVLLFVLYHCSYTCRQVPVFIKKMVTNIQMIQFLTMNFQFFMGRLVLDCVYPGRLAWIYFFYIFSLLLLFMDFAKKEYTPDTKKTE